MSDLNDRLNDAIASYEKTKAEEQQRRQQQEAEEKRLLNQKKEITERNSSLIFAKSYEETLELLNAGADANCFLQYSTYERPLLNVKSVKQAELLLEHNADVNYVAPNGNNLISCFAGYISNERNDEEVPQIIELAAKYNIKKEILNDCLNKVYTEEAFNALIHAGADINKFDWKKAINQHNLYTGKIMASGKDYDYDVSNPHYARQTHRIMKAAIKAGYDFKQNPSELDIPEVRKLIDEVMYQEKMDLSFSKAEQSFINAAEKNDLKEMRAYFKDHDKLSDEVIGHIKERKPEYGFIDYYQQITRNGERGFKVGEEDRINQNIQDLQKQNTWAYDNINLQLAYNNDPEVARRFFDAAYPIAQKNSVNATALMIDIYQNSSAEEKQKYMQDFIRLRTEGNNSERREKADRFKQAISRNEHTQSDKDLKPLSEISYTPLSSLNKMVREQKKTQR